MMTVRAWRFKRNMTQRELADRVGVDSSIISRIENNKFIPDEYLRQRIAEALGVSISDIAFPEAIIARGVIDAPKNRRVRKKRAMRLRDDEEE